MSRYGTNAFAANPFGLRPDVAARLSAINVKLWYTAVEPSGVEGKPLLRRSTYRRLSTLVAGNVFRDPSRGIRRGDTIGFDGRVFVVAAIGREGSDLTMDLR